MAPPGDQRPGQQAFFLPQLLDHRLRVVEAVVDEHALGLVGRHRARQQAGDRREGVARKPRREGQRARDESGAAAACAGAKARRATSTPASTDSHRKCGSSASSVPKRTPPAAGGSRRRLAQVAPTQAQHADGEVGRLRALHQQHPEQEERGAAPQCGRPRRLRQAAGAGTRPVLMPESVDVGALGRLGVTVCTSIWLRRSNSLASRADRPPVVEEDLERSPQRDPAADDQAVLDQRGIAFLADQRRRRTRR